MKHNAKNNVYMPAAAVFVLQNKKKNEKTFSSFYTVYALYDRLLA